MTIVISTVSACSGTNHVTVQGTVDGAPRTVQFEKSEFTAEPDAVSERTAFILRIRSAVKEQGGLNTAAQIKTFLEGKTYKI